MMSRYFFLFLFSLGSVLFCRKVQAQAQDPFEMEELISLPEEQFVIISLNNPDRPTRMALRHFDEEGILTAEQYVDLVKQGLAAQYEGAFYWDGKLNVMTSLYYPGPKRNHLIFRQFELPDLVESFSDVIDEAYTPEMYRIPFGYSVSPDSSKLMFYSWTYTLPEDPAKINFRVFSPRMEELWEQKYTLPYNNATLYIYRCAVNDQGRAYIFCENYEGKPGREIDERKVEHLILAADGVPKEMIRYDLNLPELTIVGLQACMVRDNSIVGAAFMNKGRRSRHEGIYTFRITPDGKELEQHRIFIEEEMYQAAYPYDDKESIFNANRHRFQDYYFDHIFLEKNGSWTMVAEQRVERPNYAEIEFNDNLVLQLNPELNSMKWMRRIVKRQVGFQGDWTVYSYKAIRHQGNTYLLFNDTPANYERSDKKRPVQPYHGRSSKVMMYRVDQQGNLLPYDLTPLAKTRGVQAVWPSRCHGNGSREVLLYGERIGSGSASGLLFGFPWSDLQQD